MVKTESAANAIADLIKMLYKAEDKDITVWTGYYDPDEDCKDVIADYYTG